MVIKREILNNLKEHLRRREITFIAGPRQAGKTTLMQFLQEDLERSGQKTLFLNLDVEADKRFFASQENLIKKIQLEFGQEGGFVFIDEIQRKENAGLFLKGLYDLKLPYKFIVSGSGSVELKEKIHESLVGRKRIFNLSTLTFSELVNFKTNYQYENRLAEFFAVEKEKTRQFLDEYLNFGGYPRVVLAKSLEEKQREIDEIYQSYLEKDISYLLKIRKTEALSNLVKLVAAQMGGLVNFSELASTLGISAQTVKEYLWYLEKTFILKRVRPFFRNVRKEISRSPIFYFSDLGLRNYAIDSFGKIQEPNEAGFPFQNFVFNGLEKRLEFSSATLHFWRTKGGAEVDFVINTGVTPTPIEAKYKKLEGLRVGRSLKSFIEKYHPSQAIVVHLGEEKEMYFDKTKLSFLPFHQLFDPQRGAFHNEMHHLPSST